MERIQRTQEHRGVEIATSLGKDVLLFRRMTATESLGRLFEFHMDLLSENPNIKFDDLLGQKITVRLDLPEDKKRYFSGHVSSFSQSGKVGELYAYHATAHPWLWFLTLSSDCRIFQNKKIPDIIKKVFGDKNFSDYKEVLREDYYQPKEYCVQYRETDFNFVSRLMEQEGIYYYFEHENDKHTLVLSDSRDSHHPFPGYEKLPYYPRYHAARQEHIYDWRVSKEIQPGVYALKDFNFKTPKDSLFATRKSTVQRQHVMSDMEVFDYPGRYLKPDEGDTYARVRVDEQQSDYEMLDGEGNARGLAVGSLFTLTEFARFSRKDQEREYLIVSATHDIASETYQTGAGGPRGGGDIYTCSFTAIPEPSKQPFRPVRTTPKPIVKGPQTAIVVGPKGEEIHTDEYARVKVQFHWDRYGKYDAQSSCWIRVSQLWAGAKWGGIHIPRIGQEVIVDFLEGDPDQPIITGRVYNNDNMPPYKLDDNKTQSGIKTHSSKGGNPTNVNELRFEDKKDHELIFIQAEKDQEINVKHDLKESVGHDDHLTVGHDQLQRIEGNKHLAIVGHRNEEVGGTISIKAGGDILEKVGLSHALEAGAQIHLKAGMSIVLEAGVSITLKGGGAFLVVGPVGVTMSPITYGAPVPGAGSSPQSPDKPDKPGESSAVKKETVPKAPQKPSPKSHSFKSAAVTGAPFVSL